MTLTKRISCLCLMLFVSTALAVELNVSNLADLLIKTQKENQLIPVLSDQYPELDVETAYLVQRAYVKRKLSDDQIAGFKAGLTSEESQKKFGVTFPVSSVLFASGKKLDSPVINKSMFKMLMIETEIGFTDLKKVKVADIIASNVSSSQFIVGTEKDAKSLDLDNITVTLSLNGQIVNQGKGSDTLGDQWNAALWLVNAITKQGWKIEPGYILITGVLGKMIPRKEGKYAADFGSLGGINF